MAQTDNLRKYKSLFSTTLSSGIGTGTGDTITPTSVSGLPTDTEITLTFDRVDANGVETPSKLERITGTISGGNLTSYTRGVDGTTEQAHSSNAVIEMVFNADDWNDMIAWALVGHKQDGTHNASFIVASYVNASSITAGTLNASAVVAGNLAASSVLATNIAASAVQAGNLAASSVTNGTLAASSVEQGNLNFSVSSLSSKLITGTRDLTAANGNVAYTGVGFTPTAIMAIGYVEAGVTASIGFADSARSGAGIGPYTSFAMTGGNNLIEAFTAGSTSQTAVVASYDADGFTLTWTKTGSPTGTLNLKFICFK